MFIIVIFSKIEGIISLFDMFFVFVKIEYDT